MSASDNPSTTEVVLGQAFDPEFVYYRDILQLPGNIVLLKLGGRAVANNMDSVADSVRQLADLDIPVAIIHGAGPQIDSRLEKEGVPFKKINGIRQTDE